MAIQRKCVLAFGFLIVGFYLVAEAIGAINVTVTFGKQKTQKISIVLIKDTMEGALNFCRIKRLGTIFWEKTDYGFQAMAFRHWLFNDYGWTLTNESVWIGTIKRSVQWYSLPYCTKFKFGSLIANQTDGKEECTGLNMTNDGFKDEFPFHTSPCTMKHYFVCTKNQGPLKYKEFKGYVLPTDLGNSVEMTQKDFNNHSCLLKQFTNWYNVWAVQEWYDNNTCAFYFVKDMTTSLQVEITETTENTTLFLKAAENLYQVIKPTSVVRPIKYEITCSDPSVPTTDSDPPAPTSAYSSSYCQASESLYCGCGSASLSSEELDVKIENIKTENKVQKTSLSSYTRTKTSAKDGRKSSQAMGVLGILLITGVCVLIISADIPRLVKALKRLRKISR